MNSDAEKRKKRLVSLPSVENWVRNNRPRFDETFFALSNFDKNPPMFSLAEVKKICAHIVTGKLAREDIPQRLEAISHLTVRASARQVIPAFLNYLDKRPIAGLEAFKAFRLPYPIGPKPGGGTLAIPIIPTFVGIRNGKLTPVFLIPWSSLKFDDFQKALVSSILKDALLSHQDFIGCDGEIVAFPRLTDENVRYPMSWGIKSYARFDREDLNKQFTIFGKALRSLLAQIDAENSYNDADNEGPPTPSPPSRS